MPDYDNVPTITDAQGQVVPDLSAILPAGKTAKYRRRADNGDGTWNITTFNERDKTPVEKNESELFSAKADNLLTLLDGGSLPSTANHAKLLAFIIRWMRKQEGSL